MRDAHRPHAGLIQPLMCRAPEVILRMPWDERADVWNLGVLVSRSLLLSRCGVERDRGGADMGRLWRERDRLIVRIDVAA